MKNPPTNLVHSRFRAKNKKLLKIAGVCLALAFFSCQSDTEDLELESSSITNLSSKSEKLSISSYTASGAHASYPVANAFDGNTSTRWTSNGVGQYLDIDLGENNEIDYVKLAHYRGTSRTYDFKIYTRSSSSSSWSQKGSKSSIRSNSLQTYDITNSTGRYIRIECNGNTENNWSDLTEVEIWGTGDTSSSTPSSSNYISVPAKIQAENYTAATEGRTETKGSITNVGWIDNGESLSYNINIPSSDSYDIDFRVASRSKGTKFDIYQGNSKVGSISSSATGGWSTWETVTTTVNLSSGNKTLKILATGSGWNFDYFQVKDSNNNGSTPSTGGSVEDIIGDFWKVTMPVDKNGNASPTNCSEYDCRNNDAVDVYGLNEAAANSDYNDYFYEANGWVVFTAFCGGATTTNSQYPRCELRGLDSDGDDSYFDMDDYQELNVTVKVLSVPKQRPEVNMVQIHGPDDEPLRIEYNSGSQGLHVTYNESNSWDDVMDYSIGDELKVRVVVDNGRISFWLENLTNGDTYSNDFNSSDDTGYFKVGCYLQSSISYCDVKASGSFCSNGGESDDYDATGSVAAKDLTMIRDGQRYK